MPYSSSILLEESLDWCLFASVGEVEESFVAGVVSLAVSAFEFFCIDIVGVKSRDENKLLLAPMAEYTRSDVMVVGIYSGDIAGDDMAFKSVFLPEDLSAAFSSIEEDVLLKFSTLALSIVVVDDTCLRIDALLMFTSLERRERHR